MFFEVFRKDAGVRFAAVSYDLCDTRETGLLLDLLQ